MIPRRIKNATGVFGAPMDWDQKRDGNCVGLAVRVTPFTRNPFFESAWEPTPEELAQLNAGGSVILRVIGGQPPVALYVEPAAPEETPDATN
jgi:hypothetical protein